MLYKRRYQWNRNRANQTIRRMYTDGVPSTLVEKGRTSLWGYYAAGRSASATMTSTISQMDIDGDAEYTGAEYRYDVLRHCTEKQVWRRHATQYA
ncbi:YD repeat domain protein [Enterobacter cloacae S611]|uniref:YD repeat domain protein n=1 Tax=Enterobacter cloacae S611 TaxID=1399146 RepID=A0ABP2ZHQ8_ENTCL|nr:YD repeat domain protein [Enterobacter cloacae S611]